MNLRTYLLTHTVFSDAALSPMTADQTVAIVNDAFSSLVTDADIAAIVEENFSDAFDNGETLH